MWEELLKPGASGAPHLVEWIGAAIGIAIAVFVGRIQMMKGKGEASAPAPVHELAGAVISTAKADEIIGAIDRQTRSMVELASATRSQSRAASALAAKLAENTDATRAMIDKTGEAASDMRELTREIVRSGGRG